MSSLGKTLLASISLCRSRWLQRTAQKLAVCDSPCRSMALRSYPSPKVRGSDRECQAVTAQERRPRGASPCPTSEVGPRGTTPPWRSVAPPKRSYPTAKKLQLRRRRRAERSYSTFKVRRGGREKIALLQGKEQRLRSAGAAVKRYPTSEVRETQVRW